MHLWGTIKSKQTASDYVNLMSLRYDFTGLEEKFKGLVQILKDSSSCTYDELIRNKRLYPVIINMLDAFSENSGSIRLTYDITSKSYLFFIILYSSLVRGAFSSMEDKIKVLDLLFSRFDTKTVSRLPYMSVRELSAFDNRAKDFLKDLMSSQRIKYYSASLDGYSLDSPHICFHLSDGQMRRIVFNGWIERRYRELLDEDDNQLQIYSSIADDIEKSLWDYAEKMKIDSLAVSVSQPTSSETTNAITLFFEFLNSITERVMGRDCLRQEVDETQLRENSIFKCLWRAFDKQSSVWIVPPSKLGKISKLI